MGSKQTKIEGSYLPETPKLKRTGVNAEPIQQLAVQTVFDRNDCQENDPVDPRSPNACRTPISIYAAATAPQTEFQHQGIANPLEVLRKRFFKSFGYNLNDPRSPSALLNRTPLLFDELQDRTLNLDDTFADLFVESRTLAEVAQEENMQVDTVTTTTEVTIENRITVEEEKKMPSCNESEVGEKEDPHEASSFLCDEDTMPCFACLAPIDPRSPAIGIERTPIIFGDDETNEDAMLEEEEKMPACDESGAEEKQEPFEASSFLCDEETMPCFACQAQFDPRSPTIGVERTPIIFSDDETVEDAMLENILATLSLNLSASSSINSFGTPTARPTETEDDYAPAEKMQTLQTKPSNKHLERVRGGKKRAPIRKAAPKRRQQIYEDSENLSPTGKTNTASPVTTPKRNSTNSLTPKRTPLSCVKNRSHLRSRSVEISAKSVKARLPLTSFDDNLNPSNSAKVANLRIMQDPLDL